MVRYNLLHFHHRRGGSWWLNLLGLRFRGQIARWHGGPGIDLEWGMDHTEGIKFSFRCFIGFWLTWEMPFRLMRHIPFWPKREAREIGIAWVHDTLYLRLGSQPMGTHYGYGKGRFATLRRWWKNKEMPLWCNRWVIGRDSFNTREIDTRAVFINCGRWQGDQYSAKQKIKRLTWRNRFRTRSRVDYWWDLPSGQHGIPTDTHGKWGYRYGETYGFGAAAPDTDDLERLLTTAPVVLAERLVTLLRNWPVGVVAEYPDEVMAYPGIAVNEA